MTPDGFAPFVPRVVIKRNARAAQEAPIAEAVPPSSPSVVADASAPDAPDHDDRIALHDDEDKRCAEARTAAAIRERAIRIAGEACARALHEAIARNPLFVARFVDDALEAAGRGSSEAVRLSPGDAASCRSRIAVRVVADESVTPGEVIVETADGTVGATIQQRAEVLVQAVAAS